MAIQCPSCGGRMAFNIANQNLRCTYCDSKMTVDEYDRNNAAQYSSDTYNANLYTCRSCGAELLAPDEQTVAYCAYCGGEAFLNQKNTPATRPKRIIPFKKTKKQAKDAFEKALKGKAYVPGELKKAQFLDTFHGIYLPYWSIDAEIPEKEVLLEGTASYTRGGYHYSEEYEIRANIGGTVTGLNYDASEAFDDTIANEIAPYDRRDEREFAEGYLAGFYSDKPTANPEPYLEEAAYTAIDSIYKEIERTVSNVRVKRPKPEIQREQAGPSKMTSFVSLFPVWFLTWRKGDRVAYSVMNGQTGKMAMDLPVDKKKFFAVSLIAAIVAFAVLHFASGFIIPKTAAAAAAVFLLVSSVTLSGELYQIYVKENHIYDYGDKSGKPKKKKRVVSAPKGDSTKLSAALKIVIGIIVVGFSVPSLLFGIIKSVAGGLFSGGLGKLIFMVTLAIQLILSLKIITRTGGLEKKTAIIPAIIAPAVLAAGLMIFIRNPADDYWYYGTAIGCLVAMVANCLSSINYFNYLTTRPVPNFFRREGANNAAN